MSLRRGSLFWAIWHLLSVSCQQTWDVEFTLPPDVCALVGSTLFVNCTYRYPSGYQVVQAFWFQGCSSVSDPIDGSLEKAFGSRLEYLGNKENNCSLKIMDLRQTDSAKYCFRFVTNKPGGKWTGKHGVNLSVTGLQVAVASNTVNQGQNITLSCSTTCSLTYNHTYVWYLRAGNDTATPPCRSNRLILSPVSREDAGSYSCAVRGYEDHPSPAVPLSVRYAPQHTSVTSSTCKVSAGCLVTLTCSSDANPPVQNYTFYRHNGTSCVGAGKTINVTLAVGDEGHYFCKAQNEVGSQNSSILKIPCAAPSGLSVWVLCTIAIVPLLALLLLGAAVVMCWRKKRVIPREEVTRNDDGKQNAGMVYNNAIAMSSDPAPSTMTSDPGDHEGDGEDVPYASVQFCPRRNREASLSSGPVEAEPQVIEPEEETVYAAVKLSGHRQPV